MYIFKNALHIHILLKNAKLDNWILNTTKVHVVGFWDETKRKKEKNTIGEKNKGQIEDKKAMQQKR